MIVRLIDVDSKIPNMALMKLSAWHKSMGDEIVLTKSASRDLMDRADKVYASVIFKFSKPKLDTLKASWPDAIIGGTGSGHWGTLTEIIGDFDGLDYSIYPDYAFSLGFSQTGCRLACSFCVVPQKEGKPKVASRIAEIWRGPGHPKNICLLDNDFFGQPKDVWRERIAELRHGGFKVCFNQGLNVRLLDPEACAALATIQYRDDQFQKRRLYTAWDNLKDEAIFFRGVDMLEAAGIPSKHLMAYMLIGYDPSETWERIFERFSKMVYRGIMPYPMIYDRSSRERNGIARWTSTGLYRAFCWPHYKPDYNFPMTQQSIDAWGNAIGKNWTCNTCQTKRKT